MDLSDHDLLIRIDERIGDQAKDIKDIVKQVTLQNSRIRKLENWRWYLGGIIVAVFGILKFIK